METTLQEYNDFWNKTLSFLQEIFESKLVKDFSFEKSEDFDEFFKTGQGFELVFSNGSKDISILGAINSILLKSGYYLVAKYDDNNKLIGLVVAKDDGGILGLQDKKEIIKPIFPSNSVTYSINPPKITYIDE